MNKPEKKAEAEEPLTDANREAAKELIAKMQTDKINYQTIQKRICEKYKISKDTYKKEFGNSPKKPELMKKALAQPNLSIAHPLDREIIIHDVGVKDRIPFIQFSERLNGFKPSDDTKNGGEEAHPDLLLAMDKLKPHFVKLKTYVESKINGVDLKCDAYDIPELENVKVTGFHVKYDGATIKSVILTGQKKVKNIVNNDNTPNYKLETNDPITDDEHLIECLKTAMNELKLYIKDNKFSPDSQKTIEFEELGDGAEGGENGGE